MVNKKSFSALVVLTLVFGFLLIAMPQSSMAGFPDQNVGCCQYEAPGGGSLSCSVGFGRCLIIPELDFINFFEGETCNLQTGACSNIEPIVRDVPTLSEWGLIAMAGVLGVVGFMVMRRKRVAA